MKSRIPLILFVLTALLLFAPMLQEHLHLFKVNPLAGVVEEKTKPAFTIKNWKKHAIQDYARDYLKHHAGFREPLTRLYNQYLWDFYHSSPQFRKGQLMLSDDGWLFETGNVEEYYVSNALYYAKDSLGLAQKLSEEAFRIYQLQHILASYGVHLLVMLEPGKELIYPEHLPENKTFKGEKKITAYDFYRNRFQQLGINCFDVGSWFLQIKDSVDYPLYPQTGTHWSNIASIYVADSLIHYLEQLGDLQMRHFDIGEKSEKTIAPDDDLEQLLNLIRPLKKEPNYYAEVTLEEDSSAYKPKLITIGDSYYWNLLNNAYFHVIFRERPYWYYYSTTYYTGNHRNINDVDVLDEVLSSDFVMLAYSTQQLYKMSNGFSQALLIRLCCDENDIEAGKQVALRHIKSSPKWLEGIEQRAELYKIPVDTVIMKEAENIFYTNPHNYIPMLKDSIPVKRSTKALFTAATASAHRAALQND